MLARREILMRSARWGIGLRKARSAETEYGEFTRDVRVPGTLAIGLLFLAVCRPGVTADDDVGAWLIASSTDALTLSGDDGPWRYWLDSQIRYADTAGGVTQVLLRPAIGYRLANVDIWFGYGRFETNRDRGSSFYENRWWQQINGRLGTWHGGSASWRARLEQRSLSTGDDWGWVLRTLLKYQRKFGPEQGRYWALSLEPFFDFENTDWGADAGLSQARLAISIGQRVSPRTVIELGYMNQYFFSEQGPDRSNHLATAHIRLSFR